jgi:lipoprotein-anchoring transpeptidase ErfK/SrfK
MATDYLSALGEAVSRLDPRDSRGRDALYERVRQALAQRLYTAEPPLLQEDIDAEQGAFEDAVARIEAEYARAAQQARARSADQRPRSGQRRPYSEGARATDPRAAAPRAAAPRAPQPAAPREDEVRPPTREDIDEYQPRQQEREEQQPESAAVPRSRVAPDLGPIYKRPPVLIGAALLLLVIGIAIVAALTSGPKAPAAPPAAAPSAVTRVDPAPSAAAPARPAPVRAPARPAAVEVNESGLPYYYNRQPVYFRSVYPPGSIVIDKTQRFLYVVQSDAVAWRYGIGIGPDCRDLMGLSEASKRGGDSASAIHAISFAGGQGAITGTDQQKVVGQSMRSGCFTLINDDMANLYNRVPDKARVVVRE